MSKDNNTAVVPMSKERQAAWSEMNKAAQDIATDLLQLIKKGSKGVVMLWYDIGRKATDVIVNEAEYGSNVVEKLAVYLNVPGGPSTLYGLRNMCDMFERDFVALTSERLMPSGQAMSLSHWLQLVKVSDPKKQQKYIDQIFKESWSANDLEKQIQASGDIRSASRQGGRKHTVPSNPMVGLHKEQQLAHSFNNYVGLALKGVHSALDAVDADKIDERVLEKLKQTRAEVEKVKKTAESALDAMDANVKRVESVLTKRKADAKAAKAAKKDGASANGQASGKKKKKKKKPGVSSRPVPATT